jgi:predicted metal-dependent hydrolase
VTAIPYRIRRSDRALHARILVGADGVEVVVPRRFPLRNVEPFVQEKRPWIERTLRRLRESEAEFPPANSAPGGDVPYLGERLSLIVRTDAWRTRAHVTRREAGLRVSLGPETPLREALEAWYRKQARAEIAPRLDAAVARAGRRYERLQIRNQRSRWASCSTTGTMSFNWRLLLAPAEILDYVVEHEVAHLDVQDHSQRFWRLLASRCPDWREHELWLRRHGHALRL